MNGKRQKSLIKITTLAICIVLSLLSVGIKNDLFQLDFNSSSDHSNAKSGQLWEELNKPVDDSDAPPAGTVRLSATDSLGRSRTACANITSKMVDDSKGWRAKMPPEDPSGWGCNKICEIKFKDRVYRGYFWNRSHLIADSLGGYNNVTGFSEVENLITGTRCQNVGDNTGDGGMQHFERLAVNFIEKNPSATLYYKATPVYKNQELIPRYVNVEMKSSDGKLEVSGRVYNKAPGYKINYSTGEFKKVQS